MVSFKTIVPRLRSKPEVVMKLTPTAGRKMMFLVGGSFEWTNYINRVFTTRPKSTKHIHQRKDTKDIQQVRESIWTWMPESGLKSSVLSMHVLESLDISRLTMVQVGIIIIGHSNLQQSKKKTQSKLQYNLLQSLNYTYYPLVNNLTNFLSPWFQ